MTTGRFVRLALPTPKFALNSFTAGSIAALVLCALPMGTTHAQSSSDVVVNYGALEELNTPFQSPRLIMPSPTPPKSRVILRPPEGLSSYTPLRAPVRLRPPAGIQQTRSAPALVAPTRAAPATEPPRSITSAPPAKPPVPAAAPAPAPKPAPEPKEEPVETAETVTPPPPAETTPATASAPAAPVESPAAPAQMPQVPDEPVAEPEPAQQQASLPEPAPAVDDLSITFAAESSDLPGSANDRLKDLAGRMNDDASLRLQLMSYASNADDNASQARRLSLARALSIRSFLMDEGVESTRIEVRALGNQADDGPADRVDLSVKSE